MSKSQKEINLALIEKVIPRLIDVILKRDNTLTPEEAEDIKYYLDDIVDAYEELIENNQEETDLYNYLVTLTQKF